MHVSLIKNPLTKIRKLRKNSNKIRRGAVMIKEAVMFFLDEQALFPIFGFPVIKRNFLLLKQLGVNKIIVLGRSDLYEKLSDIPELGNFVYCPSDIKEVIDELLDKMIKGEEVLLLKANHVLDKPSL
jgi:hypothetical protein